MKVAAIPSQIGSRTRSRLTIHYILPVDFSQLRAFVDLVVVVDLDGDGDGDVATQR
jgi:hypothetical protein